MELPPDTPAALDFSSHFVQDDLKLLEVPPQLLAEITAANSDTLYIRGQADDDAVLCTATKSFKIQLVESSNTALLLRSKPSTEPKLHGVIEGSVSHHYELSEILPRYDTLRRLLLEHPYCGADAERDHGDDRQLYTLTDLHKLVQASDKQLESGLAKLNAIEINGYWRVLDDRFADEMVGLILALAAEKQWPLDSIPERECVEELASEDRLPAVMSSVLSLYSSGSRADPTDSNHMDTDDEAGHNNRVFSLDTQKITLFKAVQLLKSKPRGIPDEAFMEQWADSLPYGLSPNVEVLKGQALLVLDAESGKQVWKYFPCEGLPLDPTERFKALFQARAKWSLDQLKPFIVDIVVGANTVDKMLLKLTRATKVKDGDKLIVTYTKR